jgi:long-chain acyl-CoA synthetase
VSIAQRIREVLAVDPAADAIVFEGRAWPWSYISAVMESLDGMLDEVGAREGSAVGVIARNRPPHVAAAIAALATERCFVTLSPLYADSALAADIQSLRLHAVVADRGDLDRPGVVAAAASTGAAVLEITDGAGGPARIVGRGSAARDARPRHGIAIEMLSSGTTGAPKRIPLSYDSLETAIQASGSHPAGSAEVRLQSRPALVWNPIVHIAGIYFVIDSAYSGRRIVLQERFHPEAWADAVERYGLRIAGLNPAALRMVLEAGIDPARLASLRAVRSGTAATPPALQVAFEDHFGIPVLTTYGATEFAGGVARWSLDDHRTFGRAKLGSSGRAHAGVRLRTIDPASSEVLPAGQQGVLEVQAPQLAGGDRARWVRTTDLAVIDADGFLWIRGRTDDAILRGGFKVHPAKVAAALEEHPAVRQAGVVDLPDSRLGAVPVAAVTLRRGVPVPSPDDLVAFARTRLARYEVPSQIRIVKELPLTPSMKVSQPALRELFTAGQGTAQAQPGGSDRPEGAG